MHSFEKETDRSVLPTGGLAHEFLLLRQFASLGPPRSD
jgi:hypothetical protein